MKDKSSKTEIEKQIKDFFENIENKSAKEVQKMKKLAMSKNIPLGKLKKKFCKTCFSPFRNSKVRIKNGTRSVECENCKHVSRWKINK